jgi:hypothetical protein
MMSSNRNGFFRFVRGGSFCLERRCWSSPTNCLLFRKVARKDALRGFLTMCRLILDKQHHTSLYSALFYIFQRSSSYLLMYTHLSFSLQNPSSLTRFANDICRNPTEIRSRSCTHCWCRHSRWGIWKSDHHYQQRESYMFLWGFLQRYSLPDIADTPSCSSN